MSVRVKFRNGYLRVVNPTDSNQQSSFYVTDRADATVFDYKWQAKRALWAAKWHMQSSPKAGNWPGRYSYEPASYTTLSDLLPNCKQYQTVRVYIPHGYLDVVKVSGNQATIPDFQVREGSTGYSRQATVLSLLAYANNYSELLGA